MRRGVTVYVACGAMALGLAAPAAGHDLAGGEGAAEAPTAPAEQVAAEAPSQTGTQPTSDISAATIADALQGDRTGAFAAAGEATGSFKCEGGMAGPYPCENVDLESSVPLPALGVGTGNDVWGWEDPETGNEYAIMGTSTSTGFVDVTDPKNPVLIGQLPARGSARLLLWRDIKVHDNHAFIVSEDFNSGMQVFDLTRLRDHSGAPEVFTEDAAYDEFSWAHNISINAETDRAYAVGSNDCNNGEEYGGLHIIDISNPTEPKKLGCAMVEDAGEPGPSNNYVHDVECIVYDGPDTEYTGREICFGSNEDVVTIYDVTDPANPQVISKTGYPTAEYTHQGSLTADRRYFLFGDELDESGGSVPNTTTYILDVADLDSPPTPLAHRHETESIDHNLYIHEGLVYESNYGAGLRILDFTDDSLAAGQLDEIGYFDVMPVYDYPEYAGTWSNYRFDSGTVVVSTLENAVSGLFVLRPTVSDPTPETDPDPDEAPGKSGDKRQDGERGHNGNGKGPKGS